MAFLISSFFTKSDTTNILVEVLYSSSKLVDSSFISSLVNFSATTIVVESFVLSIFSIV